MRNRNRNRNRTRKDDDYDEYDDYDKPKSRPRPKPNSQSQAKSVVSNFLIYKQIKPGKHDENRAASNIFYNFNEMFEANLPSSLNSLITIGIYLMNKIFILTEKEYTENSHKLTERPNFQYEVISDSEHSKILSSPYPYDSIKVIQILQRKFMKYIYLGFVDNNNLDEYSKAVQLCIPKSGIPPHYNYLILPFLGQFTKKPIITESFQYCYKHDELKDKKDDEAIKYLNMYTMRYEIRWIIMINTNNEKETSCPLPNSALYFKAEKDRPIYYKFYNNLFSVVEEEDIFQDTWKPLYICYEKVQLSSKEKAEFSSTEKE